VEKSTILLHQELDFSTSVEITAIIARLPAGRHCLPSTALRMTMFHCSQDNNVKNYTNNYDLLFVQFVIHTNTNHETIFFIKELTLLS